jgi:hypothetical protein
MSKDAHTVPRIDASQLPSDVGTCHQLIQQLCSTLNELQQRNQQLEHRVEQLCRHQFGPRSEKDPGQPWLFEEATTVSPDEAA